MNLDQLIPTSEQSIADRYFELVSKLAHDIRSPLATILGYTELLAVPEFNQNTEFIANAQRIFQKHSRTIDRLVQDAQLVAEIDSGRLSIKLTSLEICGYVRLVVEECGDEFRKNYGHKITFEGCASPVTVQADALRLREVILNLIDNACKYSPGSPTVEVSLWPDPVAGYVDLSVIDHGIGIASDDLPVLFTRFGKIRNESNYGINSNGLGLFIVKYIVENHEGLVKVQSTVNQGTNFIVRLPVEKFHFHQAGE